MTEIFTIRRNGSLFAFWQTGDAVAFYTPGLLGVPERWQLTFAEIIQSTNNIHYDESKSHQFPDIVNHVWRHLGPFDPLDREGVRISKVKPGRYHPKIWRGFFDPGNPLASDDVIDPHEIYGYSYTQSIVAAGSLLEQLDELFRSIEPAKGNLKAYGHRTRELLILACTEIETGWRAVLEENSITKKCKYTTNDYVKLKEPLRLSEWTVRLQNYPNLGHFCPYRTWQDSTPTQSLSWYDAYNACKHDREGSFERANLENLLGAMAALNVLLAAQWGPANFGGSWPLNGPFQFVDLPLYAPDEVYRFCCND
jgi:hypothetical protein